MSPIITDWPCKTSLAEAIWVLGVRELNMALMQRLGDCILTCHRRCVLPARSRSLLVLTSAVLIEAANKSYICVLTQLLLWSF